MAMAGALRVNSPGGGWVESVLTPATHRSGVGRRDEIRLRLFLITTNQAARLRGTLAPFFRASESPIAIACFRLVTRPPRPPLPERRVPRFSRRMALSTLLPAALPYLRPPDFLLEAFLAGIFISLFNKKPRFFNGLRGDPLSVWESK